MSDRNPVHPDDAAGTPIEIERQLARAFRTATDGDAPTDLARRVLGGGRFRLKRAHRSPRMFAVAGVTVATAAVVVIGSTLAGNRQGGDHSAVPPDRLSTAAGSAVKTSDGLGVVPTLLSAPAIADVGVGPNGEPLSAPGMCAGVQVPAEPSTQADPSVTVNRIVICPAGQQQGTTGSRVYLPGQGVWTSGTELVVRSADLDSLIAAMALPDSELPDHQSCGRRAVTFPTVVAFETGGGAKVLRVPRGPCPYISPAHIAISAAIESADTTPVFYQKVRSEAEVQTGCHPWERQARLAVGQTGAATAALPELPDRPISACGVTLDSDYHAEISAAAVVSTGHLSNLWSSVELGSVAECEVASSNWIYVIRAPENPVAAAVDDLDSSSSAVTFARFEVGGCNQVLDKNFLPIGTADAAAVAAFAKAVLGDSDSDQSAVRDTGSSSPTGPAASDSGTSLIPGPGNPVRSEVHNASVQVMTNGATYLCPLRYVGLLATRDEEPEEEPEKPCTDSFRLLGLTPDGPNGTWLQSGPSINHRYDLVGDFDGATFTVVSQNVSLESAGHRDTSQDEEAATTIPAPGCAEPAGGWTPRTVHTMASFSHIVDVTVEFPELFGGVSVSLPNHVGEQDPQSIPHDLEVINIGLAGDEAEARKRIEEVYKGEYCLVPVKYSRADVNAQMKALSPISAGGTAFNSISDNSDTGKVNGPLEPHLTVGADFPNSILAEALTAIEKLGPPVTVEYWISPITE